MSNDREVNEILSQLRDLHIQQAALVERVINLTDRNRMENTSPARAKTNTRYQAGHRPFLVGDQVRVNNPKPLQFKRGTVKKIGKVQVTVESASGKTLTRLPKNLTLIHPPSQT